MVLKTNVGIYVSDFRVEPSQVTDWCENVSLKMVHDDWITSPKSTPRMK